MQLGFDHAMKGYPYLYKLEGQLDGTDLEQYARGYVHARPTGRAAFWHQMPHNQEPAKHDANQDTSFLGFLKVLCKIFQ